MIIAFHASLRISFTDDITRNIDRRLERTLRLFREFTPELLSLLNLVLLKFSLAILKVFESALVKHIPFTQESTGISYLGLEGIDLVKLFIESLVGPHLLFDPVGGVRVESIDYFSFHITVRHAAPLHLLHLDDLF